MWPYENISGLTKANNMNKLVATSTRGANSDKK